MVVTPEIMTTQPNLGSFPSVFVSEGERQSSESGSVVSRSSQSGMAGSRCTED